MGSASYAFHFTRRWTRALCIHSSKMKRSNEIMPETDQIACSRRSRSSSSSSSGIDSNERSCAKALESQHYNHAEYVGTRERERVTRQVR